MKTLKILCVIDDLAAGGAQRQLVNLAIGLKSKGHEIHFLTYYQRGFYEETLKREGIETHSIIAKNPIIRIWKFRKFIRRGSFTSVISFLGIPSFLTTFAAVPSKKFRLIVGERSSNPEIVNSLKSRLIRIFYFKADYIVANTHTNIDLVKKVLLLVNKEKFKVIYNGLNLEKFKPVNQYQFRNSGQLKLLIPASYRKLKNVLGLIEAVKQLTDDERGNLKISWFGDKSQVGTNDIVLTEALDLIEKWGLCDVISLFDVKHNIEEEIKQADALGLFSFFEGLPNAICEGMACGKPIVSSNVSDVPLLIQDGKNGYLCSPTNIESMTLAIRKLLNSTVVELEEMGKNNRQISEKLFDEKEIIFSYERLFD